MQWQRYSKVPNQNQIQGKAFSQSQVACYGIAMSLNQLRTATLKIVREMSLPLREGFPVDRMLRFAVSLLAMLNA